MQFIGWRAVPSSWGVDISLFVSVIKILPQQTNVFENRPVTHNVQIDNGTCIRGGEKEWVSIKDSGIILENIWGEETFNSGVDPYFVQIVVIFYKVWNFFISFY